MNRIALILIMLLSTISADIIDRTGLLTARQIKQFDQICEAVKVNSGENIGVVLYSEDDLKRSSKLNVEFAQSLKFAENEEWILALVAPDGSVQISMSKGRNAELLPDHSVTLSEGTEAIFTGGEPARAIEFLLLNICDILAQEKGIELGKLLSGGNITHESHNSEIPVTPLVVVILLCASILAYRYFIRQNSEEQYTCSDFGGSMHSGESDLFGTVTYRSKV